MSTQRFRTLLYRASYEGHYSTWHRSQEDAEVELQDIVYEAEGVTPTGSDIHWETDEDNVFEDYFERDEF